MKEYITNSESPCVDGTILNIDQADCESFYWGTNAEGNILKVRCAYSPSENWWTTTSFFAAPYNYEPIPDEWKYFCQDRYIRIYAVEGKE